MKILKGFLILLVMLTFLSTPAYARDDARGQFSPVADSPSQPSVTTSTTCNGAQGNVSITVQSPNQPPVQLKAPWTQNATVSLAMNNLKYQNLLQYNTRFSCPYGNLVTAINGVSLPPTQYWGLFINNKSSMFGIDSATLQQNDSVLFKPCPISGSCSP